MRMDPITYSQRYNDSVGEDYVPSGFKPYRNEKGEYILERKVELQPATWEHGFAIIFRLFEDYSGPTYTTTDDNGKTWLSGGDRRTRKLVELWVYDYPKQGYPQKPLAPEQRALLTALSSGELRGRYADGIANQFFIDCFVLPHESNMNWAMVKYLPEVVKFWEEFYKKYGK